MKNYPTHDLDLSAVVFALKFLSNYIYGVHVYMSTDHKSLQYVLTLEGLNIHQKGCLELLKDYDLSVHTLPEKLMWLQMRLAECPWVE